MDETTRVEIPPSTLHGALPAPSRFAALKYALFVFLLSRYLIVMASALTFAFTEHWPRPEAYPQHLNIFTEDYLARMPALAL